MDHLLHPVALGAGKLEDGTANAESVLAASAVTARCAEKVTGTIPHKGSHRTLSVAASDKAVQDSFGPTA